MYVNITSNDSQLHPCRLGAHLRHFTESKFTLKRSVLFDCRPFAHSSLHLSEDKQHWAERSQRAKLLAGHNCLRGADMSCFGSLALELHFVIERVKVANARLLIVSDLQSNESKSLCCYIATLIVLLRG